MGTADWPDVPCLQWLAAHGNSANADSEPVKKGRFVVSKTGNHQKNTTQTTQASLLKYYQYVDTIHDSKKINTIIHFDPFKDKGCNSPFSDFFSRLVNN